MSALLADDFDVAGVATDGWKAIDTARQVVPDLIVLDITMPELDGFQTCRALEQAGSQAPVVFVSMHESNGHVREAFRVGARGYVVKTRIARDLPSALDHVLGGRVFAPSLSSLLHLPNGHGHAMQLHRDMEPFLDDLAAFYDLSLKRGDATCVIATEQIRLGLSNRLRDRGWDVGGASGQTQYLAIDAAQALNRFMRNGLPDASRLAQIAAELDQYRLAVTGRPESRLTIFGNMVGLLIADGNTKAVIALEHLWSTLSRDLPFLTLCGYATACFDNDKSDLWLGACAAHEAVSHASHV